MRFSDKIAYIHHDMDDAIRGGILKEEDVPKEIGEVIGYNSAEWIDHFIHDIVSNSYEKKLYCDVGAGGRGDGEAQAVYV